MVSPVTHRRRGGGRRPTVRVDSAQSTGHRQRPPSARRAHTDRHTQTALDGDALSREIFFYVELDFVCPKKDAQGTVASSAHLRSAGPPLRPRADQSPTVPFGVRIGRARTHIMRGRCARCATSVYGSEASGCRARATSSATASTERSARLSRQTHALLPASAAERTALPGRPRSHNGRARIPPTACSCDVPMVASVFVRVPVQGGEGCSMATRAAVVWLPTRPDRPCQYALLTGAATERHRHAQDVLGWRAACSGEPV